MLQRAPLTEGLTKWARWSNSDFSIYLIPQKKNSSVTCSSKNVQQNKISAKCLDTITEINIYWFVATQWNNWFQGGETTKVERTNYTKPSCQWLTSAFSELENSYSPKRNVHAFINKPQWRQQKHLTCFCCFCVRFYLTMTHFLFALLLFDFRCTTIVHNGFGIQLNDESYNCSFTFYVDRTELSTVCVINFILHKADLQLRR